MRANRTKSAGELSSSDERLERVLANYAENRDRYIKEFEVRSEEWRKAETISLATLCTRMS
jgi:hypothetical protein